MQVLTHSYFKVGYKGFYILTNKSAAISITFLCLAAYMLFFHYLRITSKLLKSDKHPLPNILTEKFDFSLNYLCSNCITALNGVTLLKTEANCSLYSGAILTPPLIASLFLLHSTTISSLILIIYCSFKASQLQQLLANCQST